MPPSRKQRFGYRDRPMSAPPKPAELYPFTLHVIYSNGTSLEQPHLDVVTVQRTPEGQIALHTEGRWEGSQRDAELNLADLTEIHIVVRHEKPGDAA